MSRNLTRIFDMVDNSKNTMQYNICLPPFVNDILELEHGYVLLIKGLPGTGKTTLSMEICSCVKKKGHATEIIFCSTRTNLDDMKEQYTRFTKDIGEDHVKNAQEMGGKPEFPKLLDVDSNYSLGFLWGFEKILKDMEGKTKKNSDNNKISSYVVVFDSVEKIIDLLMKTNQNMTKINAYEALITYARIYKLKMILVSEEAGQAEQDYLVDGIVELIRDVSIIPDRGLRYMEIHKLRHIEIEHQRMLFSLYQGRFRTIIATKPNLSLLPIDARMNALYELIQDIPLQYFFLNLMSAGKLCLEVDPFANELLTHIHFIFINVALLNQMSVFYVAPPDLEIEKLIKGLEKNFPPEILSSYFRVGFLPPERIQDWVPNHVILSQSNNIIDEFRAAKKEFNMILQNGRNGTLLIIPLNSIFAKYEKSNLSTLYHMLFSEGFIGTGKATLLATGHALIEPIPEFSQFFESFSSNILFFMRIIRFADTNVMYWVKMPRLPSTIYPTFSKKKRTEVVEKLHILPVA